MSAAARTLSADASRLEKASRARSADARVSSVSILARTVDQSRCAAEVERARRAYLANVNVWHRNAVGPWSRVLQVRG